MKISIFKHISISNIVAASLIAVLSIVVSSCQKEEDLVNLTAIIAERPDSGAKLYINNFHGCWQNGDLVNVNNEQCTLSVTGTSSFTATIPNVAQNNVNGYTAVYPASCVKDGLDLNGGVVSITIPETQYYRTVQNTSSYGSSSSQYLEMPMVAYCAPSASTLKFYNAASVIKLDIVNEKEAETLKVHYVTVTSAENNLSGTGSVDASSTTPSLVVSGSGSQTVTLDCCKLHPELATGETLTVYLVVAPFGRSDDKDKLTVNVLAENASKKKYTFTAHTPDYQLYINRNQIGAVTVKIKNTNGTVSDFWGQGREPCPYLITCCDDLNTLRRKINLDNSDTQRVYNANNVFYKQTADIPLSSWTTAIGTSSYPFAANYDGGEYSITGMDYTCGLFSYAGGGSIKNLTVSGSVTLTSGQDFGGIVCKVTSEETLQACTNNVAISFTPSSDINLNAYGIGGCVGHATAKITISQCGNKKDVLITARKETDASLGGILGKNAVSSSDSSEIKNCTNNGKVGNTTNSSGSTGSFGGICGNAASKLGIENCENNGFMPWKPGNTGFFDAYFGGMIGKAESGVNLAIKTCTNNARLKSYSAQYCNFGGMIGYIAKTAGTVGIEDCTNIGGISLPTSASYTYAGGMIGYMNIGGKLTIKNCTNGSKENKNDSTIYALAAAGGLVGYCWSETIIEGCTNWMTITCKSYSGGLVAYSKNGLTLKGSIVNQGNITTSVTKDVVTQAGGVVGSVETKITVDPAAIVENRGNISGGDNLGGIIGRISVDNDSYIRRCVNYGTVTARASRTYGNSGLFGDIRCASSTNGITIQDCGNEGEVSATGMAGGIVGHIYSNGVVKCTIQNCYCDANLNGGSQTGGIYTTNKNSSYALHIITTNCYFNGSLSGNFKGSLARIISTNVPTTFRFSYCYADVTSTPTPDDAEPTSGTKTTSYQAARTFTAPTGAYANKGERISTAEWYTDSTLLKVLNYRAESEGYASWTQPSHTEINEETGDETVVIDKLPRLVLTTPTSKRR